MRTRFSILLFSFFASTSLVWGCAGGTQTLQYTIVSNGRVAGSEVDKYSDDGHVDCAFEFNDRGRGPKIEAHYVFGADAVPLRLDVTGVDYLKAPVDEHFAVDGGRAHWKSTSEDGETRSSEQ